MPAITIHSVSAAPNTRATFLVRFQGYRNAQQITVEFWEVETTHEANNHGQEQRIGSVSGVLATRRVRGRATGGLELQPLSATPAQATSQARVGFKFSSGGTAYAFDMPIDRYDQYEGDYWEIRARVTADGATTQSAIFHIARVRRAVPVRSRNGLATYDWHAGNDVTFYADGSTSQAGGSGAYADIEGALDQARSFIFIADWSFHPYVRMRHSSAAAVASTLGHKLTNLARGNSDLLIAIHTWDHTNVAMEDRQNDWGEQILEHIAGGTRPTNLLWRASSRTGVGWSHHQKFVLLDQPGSGGRKEIKVFFGGLDMTKGRFDWTGHPIDATDPLCREFLARFSGTYPRLGPDTTAFYDDWYNGEFGDLPQRRPATSQIWPRQPWHDIHAALTGPTAWDVIREFVGRWELDPSSSDAMGDDSSSHMTTVRNKFVSLFNRRQFIQQWEYRNGDWSAQVLRSQVQAQWGSSTTVTTPSRRSRRREFQWTVRGSTDASIQQAYVQAIEQAEKFIYIETQFLIGSGARWGRSSVANRLPQTIVERTLARIRESKPFHTYIVMPMFPEGPPADGGNRSQRILQWDTIRYMCRALHAVVGSRWNSYLSFYFLAQWSSVSSLHTRGSRAERVRRNKRYMIYVHSKMMIVDDRFALIGSANLNERSLAGDRDAEICISMWPKNDWTQQRCIQQLQQFRQSLWREHLGSRLPAQWQQPESSACIRAVQSAASANYQAFRIGRRSSSHGALAMWPLTVTQTRFEFQSVSGAPEPSHCIPDGIFSPIRRVGDWLWRPTSGHPLIHGWDLAE